MKAVLKYAAYFALWLAGCYGAGAVLCYLNSGEWPSQPVTPPQP